MEKQGRTECFNQCLCSTCNSATPARDVGILEGMGFQLLEVTPVDVFPQTVSVEMVCLLSNQNAKPDTHVKLRKD